MSGPTEPIGVLIVDDEAAVRKLVASVLNQNGYSVLQAGGAAEALHILETNPELALLLTDIRMPEMDGIELAGKAKACRPGLRVLYMTGYSAQRLAPGSAILEKPFTARGVLDTVRRALTGPQPDSPPED